MTPSQRAFFPWFLWLGLFFAAWIGIVVSGSHWAAVRDHWGIALAMALGSYYGGLAITNALVGYVHAISHNLGAKYGTPHGLGNAQVLPQVLQLLEADAAPKLADIAVNCGLGERGEGDAALARKLIERVQALNDAIGIPRKNDSIRAEHIDDLVEAALNEGGSYPSPRFLSRQECRDVLVAISG